MAILIKNVQLQWKYKKTNVCVVLLFIVLIGISSALVNKSEEAKCKGGFNDYCKFEEFEKQFVEFPRCSTEEDEKPGFYWNSLAGVIDSSCYGSGASENPCRNFSMRILIDTSNLPSPLPSWPFDSIINDKLNEEFQCVQKFGSVNREMKFEPSTNIVRDVQNGLNSIENDLSCNTMYRAPDILAKNFVYFGIKYDSLSQSTFDYTYYPRVERTSLNINRYSSKCRSVYTTKLTPQLYIQCHAYALQNLMDNGYAKYRGSFIGNESIKLSLHSMPDLEFVSLYNPSSGMLQSLFTTMIMMMLMSGGLSTLVEEINGKLLPQMKLHGLELSAYLVGNAIYNFLFPFLSGVLLLLLNVALSSVAYSTAGYGWMFLLFVEWSYCQTCLVLFISAILRSVIVTKIICLIIFVLPAVLGLIIDFEVEFPLILQLLPPFAFSHICSGFLAYGSQIRFGNNQIDECFYWMFIVSTILLLIALLIFSFDQQHFFRFFKCAKICADSTPQPNDVKIDIENEEKDVKQLREEVLKGVESDDLIYIKNLLKVFHVKGSSKVAVNNLCLKIKRNEIFGLLGPNGAGKTTSIEILCGLQKRTSGEIKIDGKTISNVKDVNQLVGVCTQFDILWNDLTIKEHLEFYSRIKGVERKKIGAVTSSAAECLNLDGDVFWLCPTALSGGNRRRLSLAISLLGRPKIVLLDEPTTGLDPETRRFIWDVIRTVKESGISILLTTHSMEEADALCSQIGIMANGKLQCIGTHQHLKTIYGSGYKIKVLSQTADWETVDNLIMTKICPTATVVRTSGKTRTYQLNCANDEISGVFESLHMNASEAIREWSLTQSSLEEVFIKICQDE